MTRIFICAILLTIFGLTSSAGSIHYQIESCLLADVKATISIQYPDGKVAVENIKNGTGECGTGNYSALWIHFENSTILKMNFLKQNNDVSLSQMSVIYKQKDTTEAEATSMMTERLSSADAYYECNETRNYDLKDSGNNTVTVTLHYIKVQAFNVTDGKYSVKKEICATSNATTAAPDTTATTATTLLPNTTVTTNPITTPNATDTPRPITTVKPKPTESNTTVAPNTTQSPKPTTVTPKPTTVTPKPTPKDDQVHVEVKGVNETLCIIAQFNATLHIPYKDTKKVSHNYTYSIHKVKRTSGSCGTDKQVAELTLLNDWTLTFVFSKIKSPSKRRRLLAEDYSLTEINLQYDQSDIKGATRGKKNVSSNLSNDQYKSGVSQTYLCFSMQAVAMENVTLDMQNLKFEAFRESKNADYSKSQRECAADEHAAGSNVVPIVVGIVLALLVVVIIIAYLIGRRRTRSGYQSV